MRDRFKMHEHLEFYTVEELAEIVRINRAEAEHDDLVRRRPGDRPAQSRHAAHRELAAVVGATLCDERGGRRESRSTWRERALDMAEVDREGLDKQDRRYLETLIGVFDGGPTGVEALAATMNLATDTLSDEVEPYLLREQFITRSPRAGGDGEGVSRAGAAAEGERGRGGGAGIVRYGVKWPSVGGPAINYLTGLTAALDRWSEPGYRPTRPFAEFGCSPPN